MIVAQDVTHLQALECAMTGAEVIWPVPMNQVAIDRERKILFDIAMEKGWAVELVVVVYVDDRHAGIKLRKHVSSGNFIINCPRCGGSTTATKEKIGLHYLESGERCFASGEKYENLRGEQ